MVRTMAAVLCVAATIGMAAFALPALADDANAGATPAAAAAPDAANAAAPATQPADAWATNCSAQVRAGPLDCSVVQRVVLQRTGQLLAMISIRLPSDSHNPAMLVQTPLGLYLPAGVSLKIDDNADISLALQTCDAGGCYAGTTVSSAMLSLMRKGHSMTVTFQNISKQPVAVPVALAGFAGAYEKVK
jgi:invasion protein IalB